MAKKKKQATPEWRKFEALVARIERALSPNGAVVTSPDRIRCNSTGQLREVDASIRYSIGTCPILMTIECRDRKAMQDVLWIEQLATKKNSIGAAVTIAVSSSGFSKTAIELARSHGIELRTLTKATADEFVEWLSVQNVPSIERRIDLAGIRVEVYDDKEEIQVSESATNAVKEKGIDAMIFARASDGRLLSPRHLIIEFEKKVDVFPVDLAVGQKINRWVHQPLTRNCLQIETTCGLRDVSVVSFELVLSRNFLGVSTPSHFIYGDPDQHLIQAAEWLLPFNMRLSANRDLASGATYFSLGQTSDKPDGIDH